MLVTFVRKWGMITCITLVIFGDSDRFNTQSWTIELKHSSIDIRVPLEQLTTAQLVKHNPKMHCRFHKSPPLGRVSLPVSIHSSLLK
jgi:hypothetical protein